jgi:hypothetical protein
LGYKQGACRCCEADSNGEVFIKAQRRFLLSLITLRIQRYAPRYAGCDFGNKLIREEVIFVRKVKLSFMRLLYNYH